ncbi:MAG: fused MFS/spermidine synthase [Deltaproteobacteria bacterium]|nr:fused MFS/spermidine synthase [Deltaproteobacteria bacterium]
METNSISRSDSLTNGRIALQLSTRWVLGVLFVCFFLSGTAALVYEVVWMRMLTQIFGSSAYAVATVLAAFMAGLASGSYVFGRLANRDRNFLRLYGVLELGIGIYGFLVPVIFRASRGIYIPLFWLYDAYPAIFTLLLFLLSFVILILPTFLMGATLPVISRFVVHRFSHLGQRVGDLYGTNTLGAVLGCALAGYYLIPTLGMTRTVYAAAIVNAAIALIILLADALREKAGSDTLLPAESRVQETERSSRSATEWVLLISIGLSGAAAMVYENAWTHALTLVIGGSIYSFTTMLLTFLTGLAIGGYLYARLFGKREVRITSFGWIELGVGITALATIPLFERLPFLFLRLHQGFGDSFPLFLSIQVLLSSAVMLLPTLLLGMTFPLVVCLFTQNLYAVGSSVGTTYASNTVGAIVGAFVGGFIFIPFLGMQNSIIIGALVNLCVGCLLLVADPRPGRSFRLATGGLVAAGLLILAFRLPAWERSVLTSGVTIYAERLKNLPTDSLRLEEMRQDEILYYREGLTATVSVHRLGKDYLYLKTNGKTDGSYGDALTMLLTGYLPMFLQPQARQAAVIGLGTGMTIKALGAFPVQNIEVLEIEPAMVEAAKFFGEKNGKILEDSRVRIIPTDGRNYMMATPRFYDLIISEPSNPWLAGVASLFTRDFYAVAKRKLKPDGLFAQWIHNYSMSPDDFRMVLRTFAEAFPHVSMWNMQESDFLLVGSLREQRFDYPALKEIFLKNQTLRDDFAELGLSDVYAALGFYRMGKNELLRFVEGAEYNTDDNALLEFSAPRSLGKSTSELNRDLVEPLVTQPPWKDPSWASPAQHHFFNAQAFKASGWYNRAIKEADQAAKLDPANPAYHLLRARILVAQEKTAEAAKASEKVLDYGVDHVKQVLALSEEFYTQEATPIYLRLARSGSREIMPYLGLGNIALHRNDLAEAENWFRFAEQLRPEHPAVLLAFGRLKLVKGDFADAAKLLEEAKQRGEDSGTLYGALGEAYYQLKHWDKAAEAYGVALKHHRKNTQWRRSLADALVEIGKPKEAERKYREVLALDPNSVEAWRGLKRLGKRY